jgi:hypothetical protein
MTINLARAQRRKIKRLCDRIDREVLPGDRRFFERFPHRSCRVRVASKLEVEANGVMDPTWPDIPDGYAAYCAVRQNDCDLSDAVAREVYENAARRHPVEQGLLEAMAQGDAT